MTLYADENFPLRTVEELRRLGHDVLTALEDGRANQSIPDEDLLARATEIGRTLLTINRLDFKRLHRRMPDHAGIITAQKTRIALDRRNVLPHLLRTRESGKGGCSAGIAQGE